MEVWKKSAPLCEDICEDIYKVIMHSKDFWFKNQITRSAFSIPSIIEERYECKSDKEIANFIKMQKAPLMN